MNESILLAFIADQRKAKRFVCDRLGLLEDMPAMEWVYRKSEIMSKYEAQPFADVFAPHGFGLELKIGEFYIDYDYSLTGRRDGFDAWRIYVYLMAGNFDNSGPDRHFCDRVFQWIDELAQSGRVTKEHGLYYLNRSIN